jgi:hypothetical protein
VERASPRRGTRQGDGSGRGRDGTTILKGCGHVKEQSEDYLSVRTADYGYYNWLFNPALQPFLPALNLPLMPVTALSSGCPPDFFLRSNLHGRSFRVNHLFLTNLSTSLDDEKRLITRRQFFHFD